MSSSLALPPPINGSLSTAAPSPIPATRSPADDFLESVILPPPDIKKIADRTAAFVAKNPTPEVFEDKIRTREKTNSRFAFLNKTDAYHAYYQGRLEAERRGEGLESTAAGAKELRLAEEKAEEAEKQEAGPPKPPQLEFVVEQPPAMNAVDLDILRLTALFTARSGRRFTSELAARENRNYQFDFLRPSHSLFGYFNRLTEQYTKILIPSKEYQTRLDRRCGGPASLTDDNAERVIVARREVLKDSYERVEWEKWESSKRQEMEDQQEAERIAFAEIDWKDFVVVSTVEFTEADEAGLVELPPPMSLSEVENMTIAQKKMAAMIMEGREEEVEENERERQRGEEAEMEMDDEEDDLPSIVSAEEERAEKERLKQVDIVAMDSNGPMKIRKDYVPKAKRPKEAKQATTTFGGQQVPVDEFADHVRIELLDPKWKETKRQNEVNRSASNLLPGGTDVASSLRALASHRSDIFSTPDNAEMLKRQEEAKAQSKAREAQVWDGHTATKESITSRYQAAANLDDQIDALHRAKGLKEDGTTSKIGPAAPIAVPLAVPEPTPVPASFISGATISAAPQPNQTNQFSSQQSYGAGYGMAQYAQPMASYPLPTSTGIAAPPGLPARPPVANPGEALPPVPGGGTTRMAEDDLEGEPNAKRARVAKLDGGYHPEEEWIASHPEPISISAQLPLYTAKPDWGCDGTTIVLTDVPLTLLVGSLRDRISIKVGLPIGKQKLTYKGRILANTLTLAGLNFEDGDTIEVAIKETKKK